MAGALHSDTVKNPKLNINSTTSVRSARSYPTEDPQCSTHIHGSINTITIHLKQQSDSHDNKPEENKEKEKTSREEINTNSSTPPEFVCAKGDDGDVMFIEIVKKNDDSRKEEPEAGGLEVEWNFTYVTDFMIVEDISSIIDPRLSQVVLGKPFIEISNMTHDPLKGVVRFTKGTDEVAYKIPQKIKQYNSLSDLEKEHTKSVYFRNEEDKRKGV
ncbi:hypothetical protein Tco_1402535, partial [Tanacetum coccineum]